MAARQPHKLNAVGSSPTSAPIQLGMLWMWQSRNARRFDAASSKSQGFLQKSPPIDFLPFNVVFHGNLAPDI